MGRLPLGLALAATSSLLLFCAGEPFGLGPLAFVALVPLFVAVLRAPSARRAWLLGFAFAFVYFGIHLSWIFLFGWMAWTALAAFLSLYVSIATLLSYLVRRGAYAPVLMAGAWTGAELLRDRWPYGGYPWGAVGTTQGSVPGVRYLAGTVGAYGVSFIVVCCCALIAWAIVERRRPIRAAAVATVAVLAFLVADVALYGSPPSGEEWRVAVVQGNVPRPPRPGQLQEIFDSHMELTRDLLEREGRVDLVVWPESAVQGADAGGAVDAVQDLAREAGTPFLVGRSFVEDGERYLNLQLYIDADGRLVDSYSKRHPVPFGEYVPLSFLRRFVGTLESEIPVDQEPGTIATVFDVDGTDMATPICFESVFPRDFLDFGRQGAELYVLSTNNASFERSYASQQHVAHTRMRALETRQWVVQTALAGISASIAPDGAISNTTGLFTAEAFVTEVRAREMSSLYSRTGDVFPAAFAIVAALVAVVRGRRRSIEPPA